MGLDHALLPRAVREAAAVSARVSGADADAFAVSYLVGLAACGDTRLCITPKQRSRDWAVPLLLWVLLVAPPSSMKTAVISAARALPASLDAQDRARHGNAVATARLPIALSMAKMTRADAKRAEAEAIKKIAPPRQRAVGDVTTEKYVEILGANPGGSAMFRDELSGWLGSLGRYNPNGSDGADRAFYCNLRDGSPYDRQRMTTPSVHLDHCAGSFLGAVQPDRLLDTKQLPTADGLLQRFLPVLMREASGYEDTDDTGDAKVILRPVRDALAALVPILRHDPFGHTVATPYKLTPEGSDLYRQFADDMRLAGRAQEPSREFAECLNKMGPMWLSLALLFHFIDGSEMGVTTPADCVPIEVARRVDAMMRGFFIPHAELFYAMLDGGTKNRHRSIATAILRCPKDQIVLRDVVRHCRALQGKPRDEQIKLMQRFETGGWLTRIDRNGPVPRWQRTPGLADRFAADLEREEAARKAVTAAISGGGASAS